MKTLRLTAALITLSLFATTPTWAKQAGPLADGELDLARKLENAFVKVAEQASESVVVITCTRRVGNEMADSSDDNEEQFRQFDGTPFEFFFRNHRLPIPQPRDLDSEGSGIIYRKDGYIVTNNHVVDGAEKIKVRTKDGSEYEAKLIGTDNRTDVAVIKIDAKDLPVARLGDSDAVRVGQWAIAIGSPFELEYSFTVGFVSAKGRSAVFSRAGSAYEDYLQTDASINPGNSGGPLCDIEGRVIGVNTLIRGLNRGIGFAIPINMVREIADQLVDKGKIVRPWIGIGIEPLADNKELLGDTKGVKEGVVVREIRPNTPAAKSDLKQADIIVGVDGTTVKSPKELQIQILRKKVGQSVTLDVVRGGRPIKVAIKTEEMNDELRTASSRRGGRGQKSEGAFGLTVQTLTKDLARQFDVTETEGVVVTDVAEGSIAADRGLQHGDVITEVDCTSVHNAEEFRAAVDKADAKKGVLLFLKRGGASTFVVLKDNK